MSFKHDIIYLTLLIILTACNQAAPVTQNESTTQPDLTAIKTYALDNAAKMQAATTTLHQTAQTYYTRITEIKTEHPAENAYEYYWVNYPAEAAATLTTAKEAWLTANIHYELNEGIVAGVPGLAYYDTWLDAGPSGTEAPAEALDWQLELPDGQILDKPGNFFHHLTEPVLWGTQPAFVGAAVDLDGNGQVDVGEALPEANIFLGATKGLDEAATELNGALANWQPSPEDAFTALVTMIPTMNEYFEQWKLSVFVSGATSTQENFVAVSRLLDITGILNGLDVTYDNVKPLVAEANPQLNTQIDSGLDDLVAYVFDLYAQEQEGTHFSPEEADLFGSKAQDEATALVGQVTQAAALLNIEIQE